MPLPAPGEPKRAILDSYTKEHSAEYQAQAWIDLARKLGTERPELRDPANIASIVLHTSHHTHYVIGTGAGEDTMGEGKRMTLPGAVCVGELRDGRIAAPRQQASASAAAMMRRMDEIIGR